MAARCALILLVAAIPLRAVDPGPVGSMSGTWRLNVERSWWNGVNKPLQSTLVIEHKEPVFRYVGSVMYVSEDTREFTFDGALDNKPYPMTRSYGEGKIVMRRTDPDTIDSVFRTHDGMYEERARTQLSRDGKTLTRTIRFVGPDSSSRWVEVYDKAPPARK